MHSLPLQIKPLYETNTNNKKKAISTPKTLNINHRFDDTLAYSFSSSLRRALAFLPPLEGRDVPLRSHDVVVNILRIGVDASDHLALRRHHLCELGEDLSQLGDGRLDRLDCS